MAALRSQGEVMFQSGMRRSLVETHLNSLFCSAWNECGRIVGETRPRNREQA
jgi:hypothetical protein